MRENNEVHGRISGTKVIVINNDIGRALRKFKKKVQDNGILQEVRDREQFEKPSVIRRRKKAAAVSRWHKKLREMKNN